MTPAELSARIDSGAFDSALSRLYTGEIMSARGRVRDTLAQFGATFGHDRDVRLFSAPGRTEIGGNHTDHQRGRVLAAAVNMDIICAASPNADGVIRIQSEGHLRDEIAVDSLEPRENERNRAASLIRGTAARFRQLGYEVGGFDAYTTSNVLKGSGLSSSAAFEVAVGVMLSGLHCGGRVSAVEIAQIAQYAENEYFGKPSGLMDQMASSVGGCIAIDFADPEKPLVEAVPLRLGNGYTLCVTDTKGSHADLTPEYAAIPVEMGEVAAMFGARYLREVSPTEFSERLPEVRSRCGDRAALRAMHFFEENERVPEQVRALKDDNFATFLRLVGESGLSSFCRLQNVYPCSAPREQGVSLALAVSGRILASGGSWRIQGGGFAGTMQAYVPAPLLDAYTAEMERLFGEGACHHLSIRPYGGVEITESLQ